MAVNGISSYSKMATPCAFGEPILQHTLFSEQPAKTSGFKLTVCQSSASTSCASIHHDSSWVIPNIFGDRTALDTKNLNLPCWKSWTGGSSVSRTKASTSGWILRITGKFKLADGIDGFSEISKGKPTADLMGYNYVNTSIENAMQSFNEAYLNHRNGFNGLAYKDDPGIMAVLLTNENDVTFHFGNALLPDKQVPQHRRYLYGTSRGICDQVWTAKGQDLALWEPGPSKLFLNDLEHQFDARDDPTATKDRRQSSHRHDEFVGP